MFFRKSLLISFCLFFSSIAFSQQENNLFLQSECFKDMKSYYPYLVKGQLSWQQQTRFFHCLHGVLDLISNKKIFVHDSSRDYFTKEEIFRLFHLYFEYDKETANRFTNHLLAVKKILIGGSVNQLKDKELSTLFNLVYDYKDAYFIIRKQLPILVQIIEGKDRVITEEERSKFLNQFKKAFNLLESAYKREKITYSIKDIYRYGEYFEQAGFLKANKKANSSFAFIHNLIEGTVYPQSKIKSSQWKTAFNIFYKSLDLFLYYKAYFTTDLSDLESDYIKLESGRLFLSLVSDTIYNRGFPLKNLEEMLSILASFFDEQEKNSSKESLLANLGSKKNIQFLTRSLLCFSLHKSSQLDCSMDWEGKNPIAVFSFPDTKFNIFPQKLEMKNISNSPKIFLTSNTIEVLNKWIQNYKTDLFDLHKGYVTDLAHQYYFDHWMDDYFGWNKDERIQFGSFYPSGAQEKAHQILRYKSILSLLFSSYLPADYFSDDKSQISFKVWKNIVRQVSPFMVVLSGSEGYKPEWEKSFYDLFYLADSFVNSSNKDQNLNSKELIDLTVHLLSAIKSGQIAVEGISSFCGHNLDSSCVAEAIVKDPDILSAYPRFQEYIFDFKEKGYIEKIQKAVGGVNSDFNAFHLIPLFFLIQSMEVNYHIMDRNQSFNLESDELLLFAKRFKNDILEQVPYVFNSDQALSYIMYTFKTGNIPYFTGSDFEPVRYTNWHLSSKKNQEFTVAPNDFHFLVFDFYNLYKQF